MSIDLNLIFIGQWLHEIKWSKLSFGGQVHISVV